MKLRKPCEHGRYENHQNPKWPIETAAPYLCPGGEFLADDALIIEKVNGEWPQKWCYVIEGALHDFENRPDDYHGIWRFLLDALTVREGA